MIKLLPERMASLKAMWSDLYPPQVSAKPLFERGFLCAFNGLNIRIIEDQSGDGYGQQSGDGYGRGRLTFGDDGGSSRPVSPCR